VELLRYPPQGKRSVGIGRAHRYGLGFAEYVARANRELVLLVQIEHIQAVENIDSILAVPGVDGVFIGPFDLAASMGRMGQVEDPAVQGAIAKVRLACSAHQIPAGIFAADTAAAQRALADGFTLLAAGMDITILSGALARLRRDLLGL